MWQGSRGFYDVIKLPAAAGSRWTMHPHPKGRGNFEYGNLAANDV